MSTRVPPPLVELAGSLFSAAAPPLGAEPAEPVRRDLGRGAWVDHAADWLPDSDDLFFGLIRHVPWASHEQVMYDHVVTQPRLSAAADPAMLPGWVGERLGGIGAWLSHHYARELSEPWVNLYRDGADSVAWHGDRIGRDRSDAIVIIVSLGERRTFLLRPAGGGPSHRWMLGRGDLLVMGGTAQRTFQHCVPKRRARTGPRISITWRWSA
ncbi:MAG TPA: alpha-ketoglutarate-dependent dioxygenase AlkB [Acidimicrobiales bacterium]|jgi:alkylated DNA repair dioxygenase AlkB